MYADLFKRKASVQSKYTHILSFSVIGVVQIVNKKNGEFTAADEESFKTFSIYCGLALHHAKLYDKIRRSEQV